MHQILVKNAGETAENGSAYTYSYSILVDEVDTGSFYCESYGVRVMEEHNGETAMVQHVTTDMQRINALVSLLARNAVSPVTLRDVVEDWL